MLEHKQAEEALLKAGALQSAIFNSANFSSIATDAKGVIQIFNVGAERMLGYTAAEVMNKITPADYLRSAGSDCARRSVER
jgi:PAS domain S-box-containing protein